MVTFVLEKRGRQASNQNNNVGEGDEGDDFDLDEYNQKLSEIFVGSGEFRTTLKEVAMKLSGARVYSMDLEERLRLTVAEITRVLQHCQTAQECEMAFKAHRRMFGREIILHLFQIVAANRFPTLLEGCTSITFEVDLHANIVRSSHQ